MAQAALRRNRGWTKGNIESLRDADPDTPEALNDRAADSWRPLLAIAEAIGGQWPARARKAAMELSGGDADRDSRGTLLLSDIKAIFEAKQVDRLSSEALVAALVVLERPWSEWGKAGKPLTKNSLAALLRPFGVRPRGIRIDSDPAAKGDTPRGYLLSDFGDVFARYASGGPSQTATLQHHSDFSNLRQFRTATEPEPVAVQNPGSPLKNHQCCGVADENGSPDGRGIGEVRL